MAARSVLHVIETLAAHEGGPPRVVTGLVTAQRRLGIEAHILCGDYETRDRLVEYWQSQVAGFPIDSLHFFPGRGAAGRARGLSNWLTRHLTGFDIVHIHQLWRLVPTLVAWHCKSRHVPYLLTPHTSLSPWALGQKALKKRVARLLVWDRLLQAARAFHALNAAEADELRACLGPGSPAIFIVPNGVSLEDLEVPAPDPGIHLSSAAGASPFLLYLARLHTMKGPDLLLEAFAQVAGEFPAVQLVYAGPDYGMQRMLSERAAALSLTARVHMLGLVSGLPRLWLLQQALCLCQTSRDEGFSLSILEGLACARPVVISRHCKFPEVAREAAGLVVPLAVSEIAAALRVYLGDAMRREGDGRRGRQLIEREYTWGAVAQQTRAMYDSALALASQ